MFKIMPSRKSNKKNTSVRAVVPIGTNIEDVYPTHGIQTRCRARTPEFTTTPGVPLVQISPPQVPWPGVDSTQSP